MNAWKRLLFYLVLNIIVAAVTTLLVLSWWDRTHQLPALVPLASQPAAVAQKGGTPAAGGSSLQAATSIPASTQVIEIKNVFGVGDLQNEVVLIKRVGDGELSLSKWKLQDDNGHEYIFPELVLNKDGAVQVFSRAGVDTVIELFWGLKESVWKSGGQVTLLDPQGVVRATYTIP